MLEFIKFWKRRDKKEKAAEKKEERKEKKLGDLYERLGSIRDSIKDVNNKINEILVLKSEHRGIINEIQTLRRNEEKIQDLEYKVKSLKQLLPKIASHNVRIAIYRELSKSKILTTKKLLKQLNCSKPTLYKHLKWLEGKGIIKADREERPVKWSLR